MKTNALVRMIVAVMFMLNCTDMSLAWDIPFVSSGNSNSQTMDQGNSGGGWLTPSSMSNLISGAANAVGGAVNGAVNAVVGGINAAGGAVSSALGINSNSGGGSGNTINPGNPVTLSLPSGTGTASLQGGGAVTAGPVPQIFTTGAVASAAAGLVSALNPGTPKVTGLSQTSLGTALASLNPVPAAQTGVTLPSLQQIAGSVADTFLKPAVDLGTAVAGKAAQYLTPQSTVPATTTEDARRPQNLLAGALTGGAIPLLTHAAGMVMDTYIKPAGADGNTPLGKAAAYLDSGVHFIGDVQTAAQDAIKYLVTPFSFDNGSLPSDVPLSRGQCSTFMNNILCAYAFTPEANEYIQKNVSLFVSNETAPDVGGGWWQSWDKVVRLNSMQHEAAVHEFSHAWYDHLVAGDPDVANRLVSSTLQLAAMDPGQYPQYAQAIAEAQSYVGKGWTDSASKDYAPWELYASFASFTMGQVREGERQLPEAMWDFYDSLFQNDLCPVKMMLQKETAGKTVSDHAEVKAAQKQAVDAVPKLSGSLAGILSALDASEVPSLLTGAGSADEVPASFIVDRDTLSPAHSGGSIIWQVFLWAGTELSSLWVTGLGTDSAENVRQRLSREYPQEDVDAVFSEYDHSITRFTPDTLDILVRNRLENSLLDSDDRPLAVIVGSADDWNGALGRQKFLYNEIIRGGNRVLYYEADTDTEVVSSIQNATFFGEKPADMIVMAGHGNPWEIRFGFGNEMENFVDLDDHRKFLNLSDTLKPGGGVVLLSCSTGKGGIQEQNMANFFARVFPQAAWVAGPERDILFLWLEFSDVSGIRHVGYMPGPTYNAAGQSAFAFSKEDKEELNETLVMEIKAIHKSAGV